jgi:hypothetical protein
MIGSEAGGFLVLVTTNNLCPWILGFGEDLPLSWHDTKDSDRSATKTILLVEEFVRNNSVRVRISIRIPARTAVE